MEPISSSSSASRHDAHSSQQTTLTQLFQTAQTEVHTESLFSAQEHVDILHAVFADPSVSSTPASFSQRIFTTTNIMLTSLGTLAIAGLTTAGIWWHSQTMPTTTSIDQNQVASESPAQTSTQAQAQKQAEAPVQTQGTVKFAGNSLDTPDGKTVRVITSKEAQAIPPEQIENMSVIRENGKHIVQIKLKDGQVFRLHQETSHNKQKVQILTTEELKALPPDKIEGTGLVMFNGKEYLTITMKNGTYFHASIDDADNIPGINSRYKAEVKREQDDKKSTPIAEPRIRITMNSNSGGQRQYNLKPSASSVQKAEAEGMTVMTAEEFKKINPEDIESVHVLANKHMIAVQMKDGTTLYASADALSNKAESSSKKGLIARPVLAVKNGSPDNPETIAMANNLIKAMDKMFQLPKMVELSEKELDHYGVQFSDDDLEVGLLNFIENFVIISRVPYSPVMAQDRGITMKMLKSPDEQKRMMNAQNIRMITNVQGETVLKNYMNIWKQRSDLYNAILALPNKPATITEALIDTILVAKTLLDNENLGKTKKVSMMINSTGSRDADFMKSAGAIIERSFDEYMQKSFNTSRLVPVLAKRDGSNATFILWFEPTKDFLQALPERYRDGLAVELALSEKYSTLCDIPTDKERKELSGRTYFDTWRSCSGALTMQSIVPNPVRNGSATVQFKSAEQRYVNVAIHDMTGNRVLEILHGESVQGQRDVPMNVSALRSGMYMVVITSDRGEQVVNRMVIEQ